MQSYSMTKTRRSIPALIFLVAIAVGYFVFSLVVISCGFVINFHEDFDDTQGEKELEALVSSQHDYSQYWLGFPLFFASIIVLIAAFYQQQQILTWLALVTFFIIMFLAFFAMVLEGPDWVHWKTEDRYRRTWADKKGYSCSSNGTVCSCTDQTVAVTTGGTSINGKVISPIATCANISTLSGLFGAIVASAVVSIALSLAGVIVFLKTISWKRVQKPTIEYERNMYDNTMIYDRRQDLQNGVLRL